MTKELAKTLTTALVQFIDRERPEGTMDCSNTECVKIEKAFEGGTYDVVENFIKKKLEAPFTPFQQCLNNVLRRVYFAEVPEEKVTSFIVNEVRHWTDDLLALAKKQLLSYADESNPAIEAMADLERTFECNPEKLPLWLKNELAKKHLEGYTKEREDARREYNDMAAFIGCYGSYGSQRPLCWEPGGVCINPHFDCINCPKQSSNVGTITSINTASGTSTAKAEG